MTDSIPTLKEVILHVLHDARRNIAHETGRDDVAAVVEARGVCHFINEAGTLLRYEHLPIVEQALSEMVRDGIIRQAPSPIGGDAGYYALATSPPGRPAVLDEDAPRPPFGCPCHEDIPPDGRLRRR